MRRRLDQDSCDVSRIAILQTAKKLTQLDAKQKKKVLYSDFKHCISKVTNKGNYRMKYFLGEAADRVHVCKQAFDKAYNINHTYVDELVKYHKKKVIYCFCCNYNFPNFFMFQSVRLECDFNERTRFHAKEIDKLENFAAKFKITLSAEQKAAILIPNTVKHKTCYGWMKRFFQLMGDSAPNRDEEIHLEPIDVVDIYLVYKRDLTEHADFPTLCYSSFCETWKTCFPNVTIRQYKAVCGKCSTCATLSDLRRNYGDSNRRR
jgi:hypothetical protein